MAFMPEDVLNRSFTATQFRRGYDEHEVDDFLDEIVVDLRRLTSDKDDLREQLKACQESKGIISPEAHDKIAAARVSAENAEKDAALRIAKANADAQQVEAEAAERAKAATEAADEIAKSALAGAAPADTKDEGRGMAEVGDAGAAGLGSAAGVLALAQKLHDEYVSEGQDTRERLISEGQSHYDQVVGEATARQEELLSTGQAKYDEFVSVGGAKHDEFVSVGGAKHDALIAEATAEHEHLITEARESSTGMVADAKQKRAEVLQALGHERSLLEKNVEELETFERDYRASLKSYFEGQLVELEQTGADETADIEGDSKPQGGQRNDG
jgi:DivIVA domain-containing protein